MEASEELEFQPLSPERWPDLLALFGDRGAHEGCWCMRWRVPREQFERQKGEANRQALKAGIDSGRVKGVIGYLDGQPVAWCSVGPRTDLVGLEASEILAPIDDLAVWSVACFYVARRFRLRALSADLLRAAVDYARSEGAELVEGYPLVPIKEKIPVAFTWTGFEASFKAAGFVEVERRVPIRPIMRFDLRRKDDKPAED